MGSGWTRPRFPARCRPQRGLGPALRAGHPARRSRVRRTRTGLRCPRPSPAAVQRKPAAIHPAPGKEAFIALADCTSSGKAARRWKQGAAASDWK